MPAKITFGSYSFDDAGTPQWGRRDEYEQQGDGLPRILRTTYTIKQSFTEQSYADNEAKFAQLKTALSVGEGLLTILDENATQLVKQVVRVKPVNLPESWRQYLSEVTVTFEGRDLLFATGVDGMFSPVGAGAIALANIQEWKQSTDTQRFSEERSNRKATRVSISGSGFILADRNLTAAGRRTTLLALAAQFKAANTKEGTLLYAGESVVVKMDRLETSIGDGTERMDWSFSCSYQLFPTGTTYAEADYTLSTRDDPVSGDRITNVRGNVRAGTQTAGEAKALAIKTQYAPGRTLTRSDVGAARVSGVEGETWIDMTFDYEFHEQIPLIVTYELRVSTRQDVKSADTIITYQGKVTALNSGAAIAQAQALGKGKYPFLVSSEEVVATKQFGTESAQFIEVTFSYEYLTKSTFLYAEVTREVNTDPFGEPREVVSDYAVAADSTTAQGLAASFKLGGRILRDSKENFGSRSDNGAVQATRFEFTYSYYLTPTSVSLSYGKETRSDYSSSESSIIFSGVARGPSEAACISAIDALSAAVPSYKRADKSRTPNYEQQTAANQLVSVAFSDHFVGAVTDGPDLISAECSIRSVFSVPKTVITPIPYGVPFVQQNVGQTPGRRTVSGNVVARSRSTAESWARGQKGLLGGGYPEPDEEDSTSVNAPFDAATIKQWRCAFTYTNVFANLAP